MPLLVTDSGVRLAYADRGAGAPLVLVHGWSLSSAAFDDLAVRLPGRRLVTPDLRGHGGSGAAPFALEDLGRDLALLLDRLDLRGAVLAGWSLGAQAALAALPAVRARLAGLVLISGTPRFTLCDGWPHGLPAQALEVLAHRVRREPARAAARFFDGMFAPGELDPAARARTGALRAAIPSPGSAAALAGLDVLAAADLRPTLAGVGVPALVIHGTADPICPPGAGRALAAGIPGARLALLPGAGHAPHLTRPDEVAALLQAFPAGAGAVAA
ncbi:alpha/beta hydrolase fold protein [Anaeromyxobacter dehalogenans 2CP-1]|uniref:Alpha/beta hydrolase fold protein n=1 Tax=Anaeromyxobacter dehalogenans (strain ATCC BAA-258 / DSM 21875 / 2CP-1) TaxID=455488 RepID=B8J7L6_ANAD2|nr:alpha/beta fold hydrolase [Anaeromyxobacter dehalogenans]ACL67196.1 alpha/beta hydrolase fold protein [Anaeromyxobacter dehalogenans 2CP-1]